MSVMRMLQSLNALSCRVLLVLFISTAAGISVAELPPCSVLRQEAPHPCRPPAESFLSAQNDAAPCCRDPRILEDAYSALAVLQNVYYEATNGTWPTSIDWTGAVVETIISGMLSTMTKALDSVEDEYVWTQKEDLISTLYSHVTHSFFGQNATGILDQAYDDILWVVLGWVEAIKFVRLHSSLHHPGRHQKCLDLPEKLASALRNAPWHGSSWVCAFAERARAFWDFAITGWDTKLCHGGMNWNPRLVPYKNAITNELWISASISMYEYFSNDKFNETCLSSKGFPTNDQAYLTAALVAYQWLKEVNMTNSQGLYADGFHVDMGKPGNVECDQRDEMVYTYNQGVVLTGQRGLFKVTGDPSYLEQGHLLIQNVINSTGWDLGKNAPMDDVDEPNHGKLPPWRGLGRYGILEEQCDAGGTCSQDGQAFKGIFFHHFTAFCDPLDAQAFPNYAKFNQSEYSKVKAAHEKACRAYLGWTKHNADAALGTRDSMGRFGMWWGASIFRRVEATPDTDGINHTAPNATDYRNRGTPLDSVWGPRAAWQPGSKNLLGPCTNPSPGPESSIRGCGVSPTARPLGLQILCSQSSMQAGDANDRGRGRTVETQAGGLALLRAYWELSQR